MRRRCARTYIGVGTIHKSTTLKYSTRTHVFLVTNLTPSYYALHVNPVEQVAMPVAALISQRQGTRSARVLASVVAKPVVVISIGYCALSNISFQSSYDGSISMPRAAELGLVSAAHAAQHPNDAVLFERVGHELFEYRVKRPIIGYAGIPWLVARRTNLDLTDKCNGLGVDGCTPGANSP
jgi:hypothetical protein